MGRITVPRTVPVYAGSVILMPPAGYRAETTTEIKRSRFITTIARTDSEADMRSVVAEVRSRYPDARHHCLAYRLADDDATRAGSSDGGEPAGTAGMPMLHALTTAALNNVTAVVTRYFGGIKLGASGLTRAYDGCVADAVADIPRVVRDVRTIWAIRIPHADAGRLQDELLRMGAVVLNTDYADVVTLRVTGGSELPSTVARVSQGRLEAVRDGEQVVEVPVAGVPERVTTGKSS